ncbi:MAG: hypothetical protein JNL38_07795 [Myxococcales bacterium]|nr:hypothetical protein [Myxococcales bacterium]
MRAAHQCFSSIRLPYRDEAVAVGGAGGVADGVVDGAAALGRLGALADGAGALTVLVGGEVVALAVSFGAAVADVTVGGVELDGAEAGGAGVDAGGAVVADGKPPAGSCVSSVRNRIATATANVAQMTNATQATTSAKRRRRGAAVTKAVGV